LPPTANTSTHQREFTLDFLRGAALFGVFVINIQSYAVGIEMSTLGLVEPRDGWLGWILHVALTAFLEFKSYPVLAFLLGYGFCMQYHMAFARFTRQALTKNALVNYVSAWVDTWFCLLLWRCAVSLRRCWWAFALISRP
jgi:uncharacterized membrane protein YeiB